MGFLGAVSDWGKEMWVGKLLGEGQRASPAGVGHHTKPAVTSACSSLGPGIPWGSCWHFSDARSLLRVRGHVGHSSLSFATFPMTSVLPATLPPLPITTN